MKLNSKIDLYRCLALIYQSANACVDLLNQYDCTAIKDLLAAQYALEDELCEICEIDGAVFLKYMLDKDNPSDAIESFVEEVWLPQHGKEGILETEMKTDEMEQNEK